MADTPYLPWPVFRRSVVAAFQRSLTQPDELQYWDWRWQEDEILTYGIHRKDTFLFDSRMKFRGVWFFWEVNRGSKSADGLRDQVKGYLDFSRLYPHIRFHTIWTLQAKREGVEYSAEEQRRMIARDAKILLTEFDQARRGDQFLVARHAEVLTDPKGPVLVSATDPQKPKSILDLTPL